MYKAEIRIIDDLHSIPIHLQFRKHLRLLPDDAVTLLPIGNIVIMQKETNQKPNASQQASPQNIIMSKVKKGRVFFPQTLRDALGWKPKDRLSVYCTDNTTLIICSVLPYKDITPQ
ncbi:MAG: AbrB/MazE/SpoVT family DNA-binding domain-containing protein [Defluviitaleaceae bacterium]|nr:AbrB/MazE/SpoVT family DNA-binding domain-containing protein [Defluviitaleaceae bacterium]